MDIFYSIADYNEVHCDLVQLSDLSLLRSTRYLALKNSFHTNLSHLNDISRVTGKHKMADVNQTAPDRATGRRFSFQSYIRQDGGQTTAAGY